MSLDETLVQIVVPVLTALCVVFILLAMTSLLLGELWSLAKSASRRIRHGANQEGTRRRR